MPELSEQDGGRVDPPTTRLKHSKAETETAVAWLHCAPLAPIALLPESKLKIGRASECHLVLHHTGVSRCHGIIRVDEEENLSFEDTSSNGSFLNGKRVSESDLRIGDVLTLGPYDLELRAQGTGLIDSGEGTRQLDFTASSTGMLEKDRAIQLLQEIEFQKKSCTLKLVSGPLRGSVVVKDGRPLFASFGSLRDREAMLDILALQEGRYFMSPNVDPGEETMSSSITELLFEYARLRDEANR